DGEESDRPGPDPARGAEAQPRARQLGGAPHAERSAPARGGARTPGAPRPSGQDGPGDRSGACKYRSDSPLHPRAAYRAAEAQAVMMPERAAIARVVLGWAPLVDAIGGKTLDRWLVLAII